MSNTILNSDGGQVSVITQKGNGGLPKVTVKTRYSTAEIYLQGAHITSFQKAGEEPLLFMSAKSKFETGIPLRGGIPIIFPWFGASPGKPTHGSARNKPWELIENKVTQNGAVTLLFQLPPVKDNPPLAELNVRYEITIGEALQLKLTIENTSQETCAFEECLHTYFKVGNVGEVSVTGLRGVKYLDKVSEFAEKTELEESIRIESEVDRVYLDTPALVEIKDASLKRIISVAKTGSQSTVVWNPWIDKSKAMADFGDEEFRQMVCVESGNVNKNRKVLPAGESSELTVILSSRPS